MEKAEKLKEAMLELQKTKRCIRTKNLILLRQLPAQAPEAK